MQCVLRLKFSLGNLGGAPYSVVVLSVVVRTVRDNNLGRNENIYDNRGIAYSKQ